MARTVRSSVAPSIALPAPRRVARAALLIGFAFAVMADPVSSVAYTIEASARALHGHIGLLLATQIIVLAVIALVDVNYWQLVGRFPLGGGSAEASGGVGHAVQADPRRARVRVDHDVSADGPELHEVGKAPPDGGGLDIQ